MKALFVHDHKFFVNESGEVFSPGKLTYRVWQRYLKHFEKLIVVARAHHNCDIQAAKMNMSSGEGVSFVFVPNLSSPLGMLRYRQQVIKTLQQQIQVVDAVIIRTSLLGRIAASLADKLKKPWAVEVVGCSWDALWNYGTIVGRISAPNAYLQQKRMLNRAPFAIYVTKEFLQRRYPCRGFTAGVSDVDLPYTDPMALEQRFQRVQQPGSPFIFGLVGSLQSKWKGIQTAFSALKTAQTRLPRFEFRILGDGDPAFWRRLAASQGLADAVRFVGTLPQGEAVLRWLDDVDVYLQPSFQEGLPRALVEAMSRGCPAIGSTAGGIPELLDPAVLHQPGDADSLCELLLKSLDTNWRAKQAKRNFDTARLYVSNELDVKRDEFWRLFAEHVKKHKHPSPGSSC